MSTIRCWRKSAHVFAVVLIAAAAVSAAGGEGTVLRHHRGEGDRAEYDFGLSARAKVEGGPSGSAQAEMTLQMKCAVVFGEVLGNGNQKVQGQILTGSVKGKFDGESQAVTVEDVVVNYELSPRGEMTKSELLAGDPPVLFFPGVGLAVLPDDAFLLAGRAIFPEGPVAVGEKWAGTAKSPHPLTGEIQEAQYESKLLGVKQFRGAQCLKIRTTSSRHFEEKKPSPDGSMMAIVRAAETGEDIWWFDAQRGLIMSVEGSHKLSVSAAVESGGEERAAATTSAVLNTRSMLVELNGEKIEGK